MRFYLFAVSFIIMGLCSRSWALELPLPDNQHCQGSGLSFTPLAGHYSVDSQLANGSVIASQQLLNASITCQDSQQLSLLITNIGNHQGQEPPLFTTDVAGLGLRLQVQSQLTSDQSQVSRQGLCPQDYLTNSGSVQCTISSPQAGRTTLQLSLRAELVKYAPLNLSSRPNMLSLTLPISFTLRGGPNQQQVVLPLQNQPLITPSVLAEESTCTTVVGLEQNIPLGYFNLSAFSQTNPLNDRSRQITIQANDCPAELTQAVATITYTPFGGSSPMVMNNSGEGRGIYVALSRTASWSANQVIAPGDSITAPISAGSAVLHSYAIPYFILPGNGFPTLHQGSLNSLANVVMSYH